MYNYNGNYKNFILNSPQFLSCQPGYFTNNLNYKEYHVPETSPLYNKVSIFYEASPQLEGLSIPVIPDGCVDLVFSFRDYQCTGISVCGTITTFYSMELKNNTYLFGLRFMPGKFPLVSAGSVEELINNQRDLQLMDRDFKFIKQLMDAKTFAEKVSLAVYYIGILYRSENYKEKLVCYSMRYICANNGNVSIKALSNELIYCPRYIEQVFKNHTGFTPKSMCRLVRMHKAVLMMLWGKNHNHTTVSMECGYSDLSHMNRDLNQMLGMNSTEINEIDFFCRNTRSARTVYKF